MRKRSFRSACTKQMVVSSEQSKRQSLGSDRVLTGCVRSASSLSLRLVWKRCHGHATAANAKNMSTPSLDTDNIALNRQRESAIARELSAFGVVRLRFHNCEQPSTQNARAMLPGVNYTTTEWAVYFAFLNSSKARDAYAYFQCHKPLAR